MNKLDANFNFHQTALNLRAQRQELLAGNLANADTPNYKARDFDFSAKLKDAVGKIASPSTLMGAAGTVVAGAAALAALPATLTTGGAFSAAKSLLTSSAMHIGVGKDLADSNLSEADVKYRVTPQGSVDGNTVDADVERTQFADNALRYETSLTLLRNDIQKMLTVLQG